MSNVVNFQEFKLNAMVQFSASVVLSTGEIVMETVKATSKEKAQSMLQKVYPKAESIDIHEFSI